MSEDAAADRSENEGATTSRWADFGYVLGLFLASKAFIIFVALVASLLFQPGNYFKGRATDIGWQEYASRWDTGWYMQIAREGYHFDAETGKGNVVFFPLFPLLMRALIACGVSLGVAGLLIANASFLAALWLFFRFARTEFGRRPLAQHATALLAFSPGLAWFSIGYTESLFLMLSIGVLYALRLQRWGLALGVGILVGLTRPSAIALVAPLLFLAGPALREAWRGRSWRRSMALLAGVCSPLAGHLLYLGYLHVAFGSWRTLHVAEANGWGAELQFSWLVLSQKIPGWGLHLFDQPEVFREHVAWSWFLVLFVSAWAVVALWEKRAPVWTAVFIVGFVGLFSSFLQLGVQLHAVVRYTSPVFPLYLGIALFAENRPWAQPATLAASAMWATITGLMLFAGYHIN